MIPKPISHIVLKSTDGFVRVPCVVVNEMFCVHLRFEEGYLISMYEVTHTLSGGRIATYSEQKDAIEFARSFWTHLTLPLKSALLECYGPNDLEASILSRLKKARTRAVNRCSAKPIYLEFD